jgi:4-amino-4-deoxychorismate lyase
MTLVNGAPGEFVSTSDRGLMYGDGVFRTVRGQTGEPLHWAQHYAKLAQDCAVLGLSCPESALLLNEVRTAAKVYASSVVRITVTRGSSTRGYAPPADCNPTRVVSATPYAPRAGPSDGVALHLCRLRLAQQPALAGVKHLNRLENVLARGEWTDPAILEGLLLDQEGNAVGGTMSNLFVVESDVLVTPLLDQCGVAGVTRDRVMALAATLGMACRIERLPLARVLAAQEVFLVNSLIGLWPVARLGERDWRNARFARELAARLKADDAAVD